MKKLFPILVLAVSATCLGQNMPVSVKSPKQFTYFGQQVTDDYYDFEDMRSPETLDWVDRQNSWTAAHISEIKSKYSGLSKIREYNHLSSHSIPVRKGKYFYAVYRASKTKPASLYMIPDLRSEPIEIANPAKDLNSDNGALINFQPSKNSALVAYFLNATGGDKMEIRFTRTGAGKRPEDVVSNVKYSNVAWNGDKGVFYKRNDNLREFASDSTYRLCYHKIGDPQSQDVTVLDVTKDGGEITFGTWDEKLIVIRKNKEETNRQFYYADLSDEKLSLVKFYDSKQGKIRFSHYRNGRVYFSDPSYNWGDLQSFALNNPKDVRVVIPQIYTHLLIDSEVMEDYIICKYKHDGKIYMIAYDKDGKFIRKFDLPYNMDYHIAFYDKETKDLYASFYSYVISDQNFRINLASGKISPFIIDYAPKKTSLFPLDYFVSKVVQYKSRDGEDIPMTIVYKKGTVLDGSNPTLLEAYGGFGVISEPHYETGLLYFLEKGGIYAYPEIRGGADKGADWHQDGMGMKKMNTFNDFIDAAEYLIAEKYTNPKKLAITGGSQGGLLVGVAMTQRPELFKVAVPRVGIYDMSRFTDFTVGRYHLDEYGDPSDKKEFGYMMDYAPYYHIKDGVDYPVTLILTAENDDRVPPFQSYKFAAKLQNHAGQKNPVFIKVAKNAGHHGSKASYSYNLEAKADLYDFLLYHLNQ